MVEVDALALLIGCAPIGVTLTMLAWEYETQHWPEDVREPELRTLGDAFDYAAKMEAKDEKVW